MSILAAIVGGWSWKGLHPESVIDQNSFGNLIVRDVNGKYWRICPEHLSAEVVANNASEYRALRATEDFEFDWQAKRLYQMAFDALGPIRDGRCYCLKISAVLGGQYEPSNIGTISMEELIACSGDLARQIDDLPNGSQVKMAIGPKPNC